MRSWRKYPPTSRTYRTRCSSFNIQPRNAKASLPTGFRDRIWNPDRKRHAALGAVTALSRFRTPGSALPRQINHIHVVSAEKDADGMFRRMIPCFFTESRRFLPPFARSSFSSPTGIHGHHSDGQSSNSIPNRNHRFKFRSSRMVRSDSIITMWIVETETVSFANAVWFGDRAQRGEVADRANSNLIRSSCQGKIILGGCPSTTGVADLKSTPIHSSIPGVFLHATAISNADPRLLEARYRFILRF